MSNKFGEEFSEGSGEEGNFDSIDGEEEDLDWLDDD